MMTSPRASPPRNANGLVVAMRSTASTAHPATQRGSSPESMTPSPSHFVIRTPRSSLAARKAARSLARTATAASSPSASVYAVNPQRSRKAKVRSTRIGALARVAGVSRQQLPQYVERALPMGIELIDEPVGIARADGGQDAVVGVDRRAAL